jgi:hypothetical protein
VEGVRRAPQVLEDVDDIEAFAFFAAILMRRSCSRWPSTSTIQRRWPAGSRRRASANAAS